MIHAAVKLLLALALTLGGVATVAAPAPAAAGTTTAAQDCSRTAGQVRALATTLTDHRASRAQAVRRAAELRRTVAKLQHKVAEDRTPRRIRALRHARTDLRAARARVVRLDRAVTVTRDRLAAARVAHRLCTAAPDRAEAELFDFLDTLGLTPLLEMIGLPALLQTLGVVELLDRLGLADVLENLGLGSLIGR